jgi:hypothetical protein
MRLAASPICNREASILDKRTWRREIESKKYHNISNESELIPKHMNLADELLKLESLLHNGTLTAAEFAQAKAKVLAPDNDEVPGQMQFEAIACQNDCLTIDRQWDNERTKYLLYPRSGKPFVPSSDLAGVYAICGSILGFFLAILMSSGTDQWESKIAFWTFGAMVAVVAMGMGFHTYLLAKAYKAAHAAYLIRRASASRGQFGETTFGKLVLQASEKSK